ncbi:hypothetical protein GCM10020000_09150 [Streptomyces olivoverticillatus]
MRLMVCPTVETTFRTSQSNPTGSRWALHKSAGRAASARPTGAGQCAGAIHGRRIHTVLPPSAVGTTVTLPPALGGQTADDDHAAAVVLLDGGGQPRMAGVAVGHPDPQFFVPVEPDVHGEGGRLAARVLHRVGGQLGDDQPDRFGILGTARQAPLRQDVQHVPPGGGDRGGDARQGDGCFLAVCHGAAPFPPRPDCDAFVRASRARTFPRTALRLSVPLTTSSMPPIHRIMDISVARSGELCDERPDLGTTLVY